MNDTKSIFTSVTAVGAVILFAAPYLKHFGIVLSTDDANAIATAIVGIAGFVTVIYGRMRASKKVTFTGNPAAAAKVLVFALAISAISATTVGCAHKAPRHVASVAASGVSTGLSLAETAIEDLYNLGKLDKAEATGAVNGVDQLILANDAFISQVRGLPVVDSSTMPLVMAWFNAMPAKLVELNKEGVFHVKNPDAQAKVSLAIAGVQASFDAVQVILSQFQGSQPGPAMVNAITAAAEKGGK